MNDALRRALAEARLRDTDIATALGVDPKTVQRWLAGRVPHPRHRWAVADLMQRDEHDLRPDLDGLGGQIYREISILVYAALFLAEDVELTRLLAEKARAGLTVRH